MAKLTEARFDFIHHILSKIAKCEGGQVSSVTTEEGDVIISLTTDIPPRLWCKSCKCRAMAKTKIATRWAVNTK